ncbi:MAG: aspartate kinase [Anaerolineales bacterium]
MQDAPLLSQGCLVMKFGGTSVGSAEALAQAADIVRSARDAWSRVVVVTSAMSGVTDLLLGSANRAAQGDLEGLESVAASLRARHFEAAKVLIPDVAARERLQDEVGGLTASFEELCRAIAVIGEASPRALDAVASLGERMCVRLLAGVIAAGGVPAEYIEASEIVVTNDQFQNAHPDFTVTAERTRQRLEPLLARGITPVVTGFIGATPSGVITTLGRGGSDYSAAILGAVLPAEEVWIWTDVDGVMTADPRLVPSARTLPEITYNEIAELAYYGAKVLHPKTIRPVVEAGIGLRICNTFNPTHPGTRLVANHTARPASGTIIKAVTAIHKQRLITIEGRGMLGVPGVAARAFGAVASTNTSVPLITQASSEQSICFAVPSASTKAVLAALKKTFSVELAQRDIDSIWATDDVSIITVVGAGMRHTPGVAGQVFSQLGKKGINVLAIAQGSSEVSISMVVDEGDTEVAVKALHDLFVPQEA